MHKQLTKASGLQSGPGQRPAALWVRVPKPGPKWLSLGGLRPGEQGLPAPCCSWTPGRQVPRPPLHSWSSRGPGGEVAVPGRLSPDPAGHHVGYRRTLLPCPLVDATLGQAQALASRWGWRARLHGCPGRGVASCRPQPAQLHTAAPQWTALASHPSHSRDAGSQLAGFVISG